MFIKYNDQVMEVLKSGKIKGQEDLTFKIVEDQPIVFFHKRPEGQAEIVQVYKPGNFSIPTGNEDQQFKTYKGYIVERGQGVGGFEDPSFEKEVCLEMSKDLLIHYDEAKDAFIDYHDSDTDESYEGVKTLTTEGEKVLYQIGGGGWVWEKA